MGDSDDKFDPAKFSEDTGPRPIQTPAPADAPAANPLPEQAAKRAEEVKAAIVGNALTLPDGTKMFNDADKLFDNEENMLHKGDYINLRKKVPSLRSLYIAAGWEQRALEEVRVDIDLSCFLLDKNNMTRDDTDFLFYNNLEACEGAVKHLGDNRTGAGDGDNETISLQLNDIPFAVVRIAIVLTIYDENRDSLHFGQTRNVFVRLVNQEDNAEICRLIVDEADLDGKNSIVAINLVREGPRWFAEVPVAGEKGGLLALAKSHGIIVNEDTG